MVDSKKQGSGRDRGPTRQARGDQASGQPGSEISVVSAEKKPVLPFPDSGRVSGVCNGDRSFSYKRQGCKLSATLRRILKDDRRCMRRIRGWRRTGVYAAVQVVAASQSISRDGRDNGL